MELVELANKRGDTKDSRVLKRQKQLVLMMEFRMLAVQRVITNKGGKTAGVDKEIIQTDQEK